MPNASPRYSPVGSKPSVKSKDDSHSTRNTPPAAAFFGLRRAGVLRLSQLRSLAAIGHACHRQASTMADDIRRFLTGRSSLVGAGGGPSPLTTALRRHERRLTVGLVQRSVRGSSASRKPSPSRLNASVVSTRKMPGEDHQPGRVAIEPARRGLRERRAPGRRRHRHAEAEERERRLEEDVARDQQRRPDRDRGDEVRQDLAEDDARGCWRRASARPRRTPSRAARASSSARCARCRAT